MLTFHQMRGTWGQPEVIYKLVDCPMEFCPSKRWYTASAVRRLAKVWDVEVKKTQALPGFWRNFILPSDPTWLADSDKSNYTVF